MPKSYLSLPAALPNPFGQHIMLAPLTRGGNLPFRALCAELGANVTYGEMACSRTVAKGRNFIEIAKLRRARNEKTFVCQLATKAIDEGSAAIARAAKEGCDVVDLNCGCPTHDVTRRGLGASLLKKPKKLQRLVEGLVDAAAAEGLPMTVKIRAGYTGEPSLDFTLDLVKRLQDAGAKAVAIHGRTAEQRYLRNADWDLIRSVASDPDVEIPILGNGDALAWWELRELIHPSNPAPPAAGKAWAVGSSTGAGVLVGRGALIKPWIFLEAAKDEDWEPTQWERVAIYLQLALNMASYFKPDDRGRSGAFYFLPWHFDFFCRHRPTPAALKRSFAGASSAPRKLIQSSRDLDKALDELGIGLSSMAQDERYVEVALRHTEESTYRAIADILWDEATKYLYQVEPQLALVASGERTFPEVLDMHKYRARFLPFGHMDPEAEQIVEGTIGRLRQLGKQIAQWPEGDEPSVEHLGLQQNV